MDRLYTLNEDEAWFGFHGWQIFFISLILGIIYSLNKRVPEILLLILSSIFFFVITTSFIYLRGGWDPYIGRYLIFSIVLIMPFSSLLFNKENLLTKLLIYSFCLFSLFTMVFCIANNDSRPLISKNVFNKFAIWGSHNLLLVEKIGYKFSSITRHEYASWSLDDIEIQTFSKRSYSSVIKMMNLNITSGSEVAVLDLPGLVPDYYFFGTSFDRVIIPLTSIEKLNSIKIKPDFLLVSPDYLINNFQNYTLIAENSNWRIFIYQ